MCEFRHGYDPTLLQSRSAAPEVSQFLASSSSSSKSSLSASPSAYSSKPHPSSKPKQIQQTPAKKTSASSSNTPTSSSPFTSPHSFPALSSSPSVPQAYSNEMTLAAKLKLQKLQEEFSLTDEDLIREIFYQTNFNFESARSTLLGMYPNQLQTAKQRDNADKAAQQQRDKNQMISAPDQKKLTEIINRLKKKNKIKWVETGKCNDKDHLHHQ